MSQLIQQYTQPLTDSSNVAYSVRIYGEPRPDGTWEGWLEFHPLDSARPILRTERETTQPDKEALAYWASGLEPVYFEGALARALPE
jgi:hypothetical protein